MGYKLYNDLIATENDLNELYGRTDATGTALINRIINRLGKWKVRAMTQIRDADAIPDHHAEWWLAREKTGWSWQAIADLFEIDRSNLWRQHKITTERIKAGKWPRDADIRARLEAHLRENPITGSAHPDT